MKNFNLSGLAVVVIYAGLGAPSIRAENMASIAIAPLSATVTLTPHWSTGSGLSGFTYLAQDLGLGAPGQFYSVKGSTIPVGGDASAFTRYAPLTGVAVTHTDLGSKLSPDSYSGLTSADPNLGFGAINMYLIHHKSTGDYFTALIPGAAVASVISDLKPMSGPGGPATAGKKGYFALTFAAADLGFGANSIYYLRTDAVTGTNFGSLVPAVAGGSADRFALGFGGHIALAYAFADQGWGLNQMYYLRLDDDTGYTILGTLNPATGKTGDIANLGGVFATLAFFPADIGFAANQFYVTGVVNPTGQTISFAPIADRAISAGSFMVSPSASSGLPITLKLGYGSVGAASITGPVAGAFTVTPLSPGVITLQASQPGVTRLWGYNALKQRFTASGQTLLGFTNQPSPLSQVALVGDTASFSVLATGASAVSYQWRRGGVNITGNASATTATLTLTRVQPSDAASYDVVATNASGSIASNLVILAVNVAIPVISNKPLTAAGRVTAPFTFTVTATDSPTRFTASPLPAGLVFNELTGAMTGVPTTVGVTTVSLGATNPSGTGMALLVIIVAPSGFPDVSQEPPVRTISAVGQGANFTVVYAGTPTPTVQWQRLAPDGLTWENLVEGSGYTGVTSSTLTIGAVAATMSGDQFQLVITNSVGVFISKPAALTVIGIGPKLLHFPSAIVMDGSGNFYIANSSSNTIERISTTGTVTTLAGGYRLAGSLDGPGTVARFNQPSGLALDAAGNLYVADSGNATIRLISPAGMVTTVAGAAGVRGNVDAFGANASFGLPSGIAVDPVGNVYVCDAYNSTIRKISPAGAVTTLAGAAELPGDADGTGSAARFNYPCGIAVDASGTLFVADTFNHTIRIVTSAGVVTTLAGSAGLPGSWDAVGQNGLFRLPMGIAVGSAGDIYVADTGNSTIRMVGPDGTVISLAGNPDIAGLGDGVGVALFNQPRGLFLYGPAPLHLMTVYVADTGNAIIRRFPLESLFVSTPALTAGPPPTVAAPVRALRPVPSKYPLP